MSILNEMLREKTENDSAVDATPESGLEAVASFIHFIDTATPEELKELRDRLKGFRDDQSGQSGKRLIAKDLLPIVAKQIKAFY